MLSLKQAITTTTLTKNHKLYMHTQLHIKQKIYKHNFVILKLLVE